jgi:mannose-6-phosphate isomerase-like protein (cupin superfamily)
VRYSAPSGQIAATFRPATTPRDLELPKGGGAAYLATSALTGADYGLFRWEMSEQPSGPAPHFHRTMSEAFFVLEGSVRLHDGARTIDAGPGDFLFVPPGGIHGFRNESGAPATMLILFAPGAPRERYFEELADIARSGRQLSEEEWTELYARHDQYMSDLRSSGGQVRTSGVGNR